MRPSLIEMIHMYIRKSVRTRVPPPKNEASRQSSKTYPRMPRIHFPALSPLDIRLTDALSRRISGRASSLSNPVTLEELGMLLGHSLGSRMSQETRNYPSGGGLFPLETYLLVNNVTSLERHIYHYDPDAHALEDLWPLPEDLDIAHLMYGYQFAAFSSCILFFTCAWDRSRSRYGDFAYLLSLIESGGAGQNVGLLAAALDLEACDIAGFEEEKVAQLLDIPASEQALYAIAIGKKTV